LYAKRSLSYSLTFAAAGVIAVGALIWFAAPIVVSAMAVLPAVGFGGLAIGLVLAAGKLGLIAGATIGTGLLVSGFVLAYKTLDGINVEIKNENNKNRSQIIFHNRYCDEKPRRNDNETRKNPRRDERSRGKKGEKSKKKEESKREEHGKSTEANNEFETETFSLETKVSELKRDNHKEEAVNALQAEKKKLEEETKNAEISLQEVTSALNVLNTELDTLNAEVERKTIEKQDIMSQIDEINKILKNQHENLSENQANLMQSIESYLNSQRVSQNAWLKTEFAKIKKNGSIEVKENLNQAFMSLKSELDKKCSEILYEKLNLQSEIIIMENKKQLKQKEIETLKNQELASLRNRLKSEQELVAINELQQRMKVEQNNEKTMEQTEEVMVMKEFKKEPDNEDNNNNKSIKLEDFVNEQNYSNWLKINENNYLRLFAGSKPKIGLNDLIKDFVTNAKDHQMDVDKMIGKLEFLITTVGFIGEKDERLKEMFQLRNIFKNIKEEPLKHLEFYFKDATENYFKMESKLTISSDLGQISIMNFLDKCTLFLHYDYQSFMDETKENFFEKNIKVSYFNGFQTIIIATRFEIENFEFE